MASFSIRKAASRRAVCTVIAVGLMALGAGLLGSTPARAATPRQIGHAYSQAPDTPTALSTSPTTDCHGQTILGDGNVSFYAVASDPDGGTLGVDFEVWNASTGATVASSDPGDMTVPSGSAAALSVQQSTLENSADNQVTQFDWKVRVTDFTRTSGWSTTCAFRFDPTRPETPSLSLPDTTTIGQPFQLVVSPAPAPSGQTLVTPSGYSYQLNSGAPASVTADSNGDASITITPTRATNQLTVTGLSAGGNYGDATTVTFNSNPAPPEADGDLTGDGVPDLLTVGGQHGLPSGIWLAPGQTDGHVTTTPTDIGEYGDGISSDESPSDFDGADVITGRFTGGSFQDLLVYFPTGNDAGGAVILKGNGDGSPIDAQDSDNESTISSGGFVDDNGNNLTQLINAGDTSGDNYGYPDLIGTSSDGLYFIPSQGGTANYGIPTNLGIATPDGSAWNDWTVESMQLSTAGGGSSTALFLWNKSTGDLYLWKNLALDQDTGVLSYDSYEVQTNWNTGADVSLEAADINGDGVPDLWTVGANGSVTANLFSDLSAGTTATLTTVTDTLTVPDAASATIRSARHGAGA